MARRPPGGCDLAHNKHSLHGASQRDIRRRRQRRKTKEGLRDLIRRIQNEGAAA